MAGPGLTAQPLDSPGAFNWIYLIDFIVDGILVLAFLFYFNRLFATIVSYVIRLVAWHKFGIYIDIQALQISPLAGRIFFKGIRYHGENVTLLVHGGYITWRYWYPKVKECQVFDLPVQNRGGNFQEKSTLQEPDESRSPAGEASHDLPPHAEGKKLPCRLSVKVSGVEAFLYNRSPSYDAILEHIKQKNAMDVSSLDQMNEKTGDGSLHARQTQTSSSNDSRECSAKENGQVHRDEVIDRNVKLPPKSAPPALLRLLPIKLEVNTGAVVLGNENTKSIITAKFDSASGEFDACHSGPLDLFKILMSFDVTHPYIQLKPNVDYKQPQLKEAADVKERQRSGVSDFSATSRRDRNGIRGIFADRMSWLPRPHKLPFWPNGSNASLAGTHNHRLSNKNSSFLPSPPPTRSLWLGLTRYLGDDQQDEHQEWDPIEYAKSSVLADIKEIGLTFFWEIPGAVRPIVANSGIDPILDDINGSAPPEYGISLFVRGGYVTYGPWADRHRVIVQQIFFPATFADAIPATKLKTGETRMSTIFNLKLTIEEDVTLRIPFREPSKDWMWKGRASALTARGKSSHSQSARRGRRRKGSGLLRKRTSVATGADIRPFAWFDITVKPGSIICYDMDMIARNSGYRNTLNVNVSAIDIYSSLNHALLWRSGMVTINSDLSNPIEWNTLRPWRFNIQINSLDFFLLRDHTFLLMDLIQDWGAGPLPEFLTFVPFQYLLNVQFKDFKMYLNTNDANIINNSEDIDDNEFIILYGRELESELLIPLDRFRPVAKDITFDVKAYDLGFRLCMPSRNTISTLVADKDVAHLGNVTVQGTYNACSEVLPGMVDTLHMTIIGKTFTLMLYGFLGRHLIKLKENYFGESVHFTTLEEYQDILEGSASGSPPDRPRPVANNLDVILDIAAKNINILLPANLYDCEEHVRIHVNNADVDLRVSNYYLELMVNSTPLEFSYTSRLLSEEADAVETSKTQLFLDGIKVFGHRLFGSQPSNPNYMSNWDIDAGSIRGECDTGFVEKLVAAGLSLFLTFNDAENAQPVARAPDPPDSSFVRFLCPLIHISCQLGQQAILLKTGTVQGTFNDWANAMFSQRLFMTIPDVILACVDRDPMRIRTKDRKHKTPTHAYVKTSISLEMVQRCLHFQDQRKLQQEHIIASDRQSSRAQFLVTHGSPLLDRKLSRREETDILSLPLPNPPHPLGSGNEEIIPDSLSSSLDYYSAGVVPSAPNNRSLSFDSFTQPVRQTTWSSQPINEAANDYGSVSMAFSSVFKCPNFPLDDIEPDLTDVPRLQPNADDALQSDRLVNDAKFEETYDDAHHASFIVRSEPGISVLCTPEAVRMVVKLLEQSSPRQPAAILDRFQVTTVTEVLSSYSKQRGTNAVTDLKASVPHLHVRFVNSSRLDELSDEEVPSDRYNLIANDTVVTCRFKTVPQRPHEADAICMHARMGYLAISAQEGSNESEKEDAALEVVIEDILLWLVDSDRTSISSSIRNIEVSMASRKIQYLAKLIHRTTIIADNFQHSFITVLAQPEKRLRYLVYQITRLDQDVPDPAFLTRPSYAIRSSPDHIRNSDSWKILSRLRHVYQNLSDDDKEKLKLACLHGDVQCPQDAEIYVMNALNNWRGWDSLMINDSYAMRILYGSTAKVEKLHDRSSVPLGLAIRSERFKLVIDRGPKPNKFSIHDLFIRLAIRPPSPPSGLAVFQEYDDKRSTTLQIHSSKLSLNLNWKVLHLIDYVMTLFERRAPGHHDPESENEISHLGSGDDPIGKLHIVFATQTARVKLTTINLRQIVVCEDLKLSVAGEDWSADADDTSVNMFVAARIASAEMRGHHRLLWHTKVTSPNLWLAYERHVVNEKFQEALKLAAASQSVKVQVHDEILGFFDIISSVVDDEAVYLTHLSKTHDPGAIKSSKSQQPTRARLPMLVDLALLLNTYHVEVSILEDLHYSARGQIARLFVSPDRQLASTYQIGFDIKSQTHFVSTGSLEKRHTVSEIQMPPINGSVRLLLTEQSAIVSATISIERILFDASAIHGIFSILGSTRVVTASESIKEDIAAIREKVMKTFPGTNITKKVETSETKKPVVFDMSLVIGGFALSAAAPSSSDAVSAQALFEVQSIYIRAANRSANEESPLPFPEFRIALERIHLQLQANVEEHLKDCGSVLIAAFFTCTMSREGSSFRRNFHLSITGPLVEVFAETAPTAAIIATYLQARLKNVNLSMERKYLRRLRHLDNSKVVKHVPMTDGESIGKIEFSEHETASANLGAIVTSFAFDLQQFRVRYSIRDSVPKPVSYEEEYLDLTLESISLLARSEKEARLSIANLQLALIPVKETSTERPRNSALLPEVVFNVKHKSSKTDHKLAFHAAGKALDIQIEPQFILPASDIEHSITISRKRLQSAAANLDMAPATTTSSPTQKLFGGKTVSSMLLSADFAGAVVRLQGKNKDHLRKSSIAAHHLEHVPQHGRYGQFSGEDATTNATLRAPGVAFRIQYKEHPNVEPSLNVEVRVDASNNVIYPAVVPLILQISESVKQIVRDPEPDNSSQESSEQMSARGSTENISQKSIAEDVIVGADPSAILGKTRLSLGLQICRQEFSLSCQPIAKVAASAKLEDMYFTVNSVQSPDSGTFLAASAAFTGLSASLKHVYSREGTFNFGIESVMISLMNSKHFSGVGGISAILKINPSRAQINAKQLQDVLLFREIWLPPEIRHASESPESVAASEPQDYFVQRYKRIAETTAFPWHATVVVAELGLDLDLGQAIGKSSFSIKNLWASSKKNTSSQQNLCIGVDEISMRSSGRMSGFVGLEKVKVRTSIAWPSNEHRTERTPLIQASIGFEHLQVKAAFDYQTFAVADVTRFEFIMYNVRDERHESGDRLVAILDGEKVNAYCIAASAALGVSLFQAFDRLIQERAASYEQSLRDIERFLKRRMSMTSGQTIAKVRTTLRQTEPLTSPISPVAPLSLYTDVVVTLRSLDVGVFPSTLTDNQIVKGDAYDVEARFAATLKDDTIHSSLGMTLGQLRVALATVPHHVMPKTLGEVSAEEVLTNASAARGGVILRVPKVLASMQTWQPVGSTTIDYTFKSIFEGKIDVGWNYSRISFIRGMWATHMRTLATRIGKPLPESAVKIHGAPQPSEDTIAPATEESGSQKEQQKITAVVNLPQSNYTYRALEPPIIDTPQLRDMGEATPPLEWIGLHRDRLPNITHQIVIVTLLEVAREVEDAYSRILGST